MRNPNPEMLLRIAQADAYCMATEYIRLPNDQAVHDAAMALGGYVKHPTYALRAGQYTDDTQMSIAVTEQLLSGESITKLSFAEHFMGAFLRDPRDGYSRGFQAILEASTTGAELIARLDTSSTKNGAAMRSVPLGVIRDTSAMLEVAQTQAAVTHDTPDGIMSSQAVAYLSWWGMHTDDPFDMCCDRLAIAWPMYEHVFTLPWSGRVKSLLASADGRTPSGRGHDVGVNTAWAVATLLREERTLVGILRRVIEWGGDTDSVAAIAWGIASSRMREAVPAFMDSDLEPGGQYGAQFLLNLGARLMEMYG